jgi:hypothetical protein
MVAQANQACLILALVVVCIQDFFSCEVLAFACIQDFFLYLFVVFY